MQFAEALSRNHSWREAVDEVTAAVHKKTTAITTAIVFLAAHHTEHAAEIADALCDACQTETLIGCTAKSVVGDRCEWEEGPSLALWVANLPDTQIVPMQLQYESQTDGGSFVGWPSNLPIEWPNNTAMLILGDPFTFPADQFIESANHDQPGIPIIGGMASGGMRPGSNRLLFGRHVEPTGAVALWLHGGVDVQTVVSQGCRPIGQRFVITKAERNIIQELGGKSPTAQLQSTFVELPREDQQLFRDGFHIGRVMNEHQGEFSRGDFLIRSILGSEEKSGALIVGDLIRIGQTVQFHVRDAESASDDLTDLLAAAQQTVPTQPAGGLLFTCNGRGQSLFGKPHHDINCLHEQWPQLPVSGIFAAGELGPVGGSNFLHGFTASVALFYPSKNGPRTT